MIKEISNLLLNRNFTKKLGIPDQAIDLHIRVKSLVIYLLPVKSSASSVEKPTESESIAKSCDTRLAQLTVQVKFLSVTELEAKDHV